MAGAVNGYANRMPALRQARHPALIARFGSPGDARAAIEALENHGIDGLEVAVLDRPDGGPRRPADTRALVHVSGRVGKGLGTGALVGAAIFGVIALGFAVAGLPIGAIVALLLIGAALGATVGAFWSVERGVGLSEDWEKTFQKPTDAATSVRIGVYTQADSDTTRAREVLEDHRPLDVRTPA
jgi:hypothetical protein